MDAEDENIDNWNPLHDLVIDETGKVISSNEKEQQDKEADEKQKKDEKERLEKNKKIIEELVDPIKFHSFVCGVLGVVGKTTNMESLQDIDNQYPTFNQATDEMYKKFKKYGWFDGFMGWDIEELQSTIRIFMGLSPVVYAGVSEFKSKRQGKKRVARSQSVPDVANNDTPVAPVEEESNQESPVLDSTPDMASMFSGTKDREQIKTLAKQTAKEQD